MDESIDVLIVMLYNDLEPITIPDLLDVIMRDTPNVIIRNTPETISEQEDIEDAPNNEPKDVLVDTSDILNDLLITALQRGSARGSNLLVVNILQFYELHESKMHAGTVTEYMLVLLS